MLKCLQLSPEKHKMTKRLHTSKLCTSAKVFRVHTLRNLANVAHPVLTAGEEMRITSSKFATHSKVFLSLIYIDCQATKYATFRKVKKRTCVYTDMLNLTTRQIHR